MKFNLLISIDTKTTNSIHRFLHPHFSITIDQTCSIPGLYFLFLDLFSLFNIRLESATSFFVFFFFLFFFLNNNNNNLFTNSDNISCSSFKIGAKTGSTLQSIYLLKQFRIKRISHNYEIPHVMTHAIPQTYSFFYLHR